MKNKYLMHRVTPERKDQLNGVAVDLGYKQRQPISVSDVLNALIDMCVTGAVNRDDLTKQILVNFDKPKSAPGRRVTGTKP